MADSTRPNQSRRLLALLLVLLLSAGVWAWRSATEAQRDHMRDILGLDPPSPAPAPTPPAVAPRLPDLPLADLLAAIPQFDVHPLAPVCTPEQVPHPSRAKTTAVFRWTDEQGRVSFSDRPPANAGAERVLKDAPPVRERFSLELQFDDLQEPLGLRDGITAGGQAIYGFLESDLGQSRLPGVHVQVALVASSAAYRKRAPSPALYMTNGFYSFRDNQAVVRYRDRDQAIAVARHEITHLILGNLYGDLDTWLAEGLAETFERLRIEGLGKRLMATDRELKGLRHALRQQRVPPLPDLLRTKFADWQARDPNLMYGCAWSLVHYLLADTEHRRLLADLLVTARRQRCTRFSAADHLAAAYPGGLAALEKEWRAWLLVDGDRSLSF